MHPATFFLACIAALELEGVASKEIQVFSFRQLLRIFSASHMAADQTKQQAAKRAFKMFETAESAGLWFDIFNGVLLFGAFLVFVGTWGTIKTSSVKERFSNERVALNEAETKRAVAESDKANAELEKARVNIATADAEAAKANERAAELRLELDREIAARKPRTISAEQRAALVEMLKPDRIFKGKVSINAAMEAEAMQFADQIESVLKEAGFDVKQVDFGERAITFNMPGQWIVIKDLNHQPRHGGPISKAFQNVGINFVPQVKPETADDLVVIEISSHP